jgi:hypothetical protein
MTRKVFYSFHYKPDVFRAAQVRNIGVVEGNPSASDHDWESITNGGEEAIKKWIDDQLLGRSCTIVLIGENTAGRKWIEYEIKKSYDSGKGLLGIYIHRLKDIGGNQANKGKNPFEGFTVGEKKLTDLVRMYDPPFWDSKEVYKNIHDNISDWIEKAVKDRGN